MSVGRAVAPVDKLWMCIPSGGGGVGRLRQFIASQRLVSVAAAAAALARHHVGPRSRRRRLDLPVTAGCRGGR